MKNIAVYTIEKNNQLLACIWKFCGTNRGALFVSTVPSISEEEYQSLKDFIRSFGGDTMVYANKMEKIVATVNLLNKSNFIMHNRSTVFEKLITDRGHKFEVV